VRFEPENYEDESAGRCDWDDLFFKGCGSEKSPRRLRKKLRKICRRGVRGQCIVGWRRRIEVRGLSGSL